MIKSKLIEVHILLSVIITCD